MLISKHSPKDCPALSESTRKVTLEYLSKSGELLKKHGIKRVTGWVSCTPPEHINLVILEAPTIEAFMEFTMEPAFAKYIAIQDEAEYRIAMTSEEGMKIVVQASQ